MQSFDSVLLLIALLRYPHDLCTCASAIESVIKASHVGRALGRSGGSRDLMEAAQRHSAPIAAFPPRLLKEFRGARNRFTHYGFSPKDDSEAVDLLVAVGLPFLELCYQHLHSFDLRDALRQEYAKQWKVAETVLRRAKGVSGLDRSYCLQSLGHLIRWCLKDNFSARWEIDELLDAETTGTNWDFMLKERKKLERLYGTSWVFRCPLCGDVESAVCELDDGELDSRNVVPVRMACVNCGFVVQKSERFLSEVLLQEEATKAREGIFKELGL